MIVSENRSVNPREEHTALFTQTGLKLGKVLWYLLNAAQEMGRRTTLKRPAVSGIGYTIEHTSFSDEVGSDEIYWWIYKKESNIDELRSQVDRALTAVQVLTEQIKHLDAPIIQTYQELVLMISQFIEKHEREIEGLYNFVVWLHQRDDLAPSMLFTQRVWGATRRSDRWVELDISDIERESADVLELLTEIACGLARPGGYTRFYEAMHISEELYDSDPENFHSGSISESQVASRAAYKTVDEFTTFIRELRDSLRNIELDIGKYLAGKSLLKSEIFWEQFIIKAKNPNRVESSLWDFKETLPMWHATGAAAQKEQIDFCKLVAAFANRDGGAIIIGVRDKSREVLGILDLENRMKSMEGTLRRWIEYPRLDAIVHLQSVPIKENKTTVVCLVAVVAQAESVVGVKGIHGEYHYPVREQAGIINRERRELETRKTHLKAGDNFGFIKDLDDFLHDK